MGTLLNLKAYWKLVCW